MSSTANVYAPPARTEQDVAVEVVVRLMEAKIIPMSPRALHEASIALRLPVKMIQRCWEVRNLPTGNFRNVMVDPDPEEEILEPLVPIHKDTYHPAAKAANERKRAKKEPTPETRICSKCKVEKKKTEFEYKNKRTLQLRSMCTSCLKGYKKDRYLTSERIKVLGPILRLVIEPDDEHAGSICPDCRKPCRVGDEVICTDVVFHHASHFEPPNA